MNPGRFFPQVPGVLLLAFLVTGGMTIPDLAAQDQAASPPPGFRCLVLSRSHSQDPSIQELHRALEQEFLNTLFQAPGLAGLTRETRFQAMPTGDPDRKELGILAGQGWQAVLILDFRELGDRTNLTTRIMDPVLGTMLHSGSKSGTHDLSFYRLIQELGEATGRQLSLHRPVLASPRKGNEGVLTLAGIVISSPDEGAELVMNGWVVLGTVESGRFEFPLPLARGKSITLMMRKKGYHPRYFDIMPIAPDQTFTVGALVPLRSWEAWLAWDPVLPASVSAGFRFYPLPDQWFVELEGGLRDLDATWVSQNDNQDLFNTSTLVALPVRISTRWAFSTGWYFGMPEDVLRVFAMAGFGFQAASGAGNTLVTGNAFISFPQAGIELNLGTFRIALSLGSEYILDSDHPLLEPGNSRFFMPGRFSLGVAW